MTQKGKINPPRALSHTNELRIARRAMGASKRSVVKRLDDICLALRVCAEKNLNTRIKTKIQRFIVPIRVKLESCDPHNYKAVTR